MLKSRFFSSNSPVESGSSVDKMGNLKIYFFGSQCLIKLLLLFPPKKKKKRIKEEGDKDKVIYYNSVTHLNFKMVI